MRIHISHTNRSASLQGLLPFAKGPIGVKKTVPNKRYEAPAMVISILHQQTTEPFLILGVHVGSWQETSSRKKRENEKE